MNKPIAPNPNAPAVNPTPHNDATAVISELQEATRQGFSIAENSRKAARLFSLESTSVLVGTFGIAIGSAAAYGLSIAFNAISFPVAEGIAIIGGLSGALLMLRGPKSIGNEQKEEQGRRKAKAIADDFEALPAPLQTACTPAFVSEYQKARFGHVVVDVTPVDGG
ncbi:hypothetical protein [Methylobacterium brachiatum]|uniref:hypothetical protein n=1 Tax=Methylobacterium brachiatum TaxID=269660 RepID=UPI001113C777|nr:hypothetical protein [Methylobacterium brachiatum]